MAVVIGPITLTGGVGVKPMIKYMASTDSMATITTAGYLNEKLTNIGQISETDMLLIRYNYVQETEAGTNAFFTVSIASNGSITLAEDVSEGNVVFPVAANKIAVFSDSAGKIKVAAAANTISTAAQSIEVGGDTVNGKMVLKVGGANVGSLTLQPGNNASANQVVLSSEGQDINVTVRLPKVAAQQFASINMMEWDDVTPPATVGNILKAATNKGIMTDAGIAANKILTSSFATPDTNANLVFFSVTVTAADLAAGGLKALITSSGAKQYSILSMNINANGATNFSGGGGDRNFKILAGANVYSVIPSGSLTIIVNRAWLTNAAGFPLPASVGTTEATPAGTSLSMSYDGGTTDYAAGTVIISGLAVRVA